MLWGTLRFVGGDGGMGVSVLGLVQCLGFRDTGTRSDLLVLLGHDGGVTGERLYDGAGRCLG